MWTTEPLAKRSERTESRMTEIVNLNGIGKNSLATSNRRKVFLSTYSLNSNESSIESPHGTPPLRRHSDIMRGSKIRQPARPEENQQNVGKRELSPRASIQQRRGSLMRMSKAEPVSTEEEKILLMKTCSMFLQDKQSEEKGTTKCHKKKNRKIKSTYTIYNCSPKKNVKSLHQKGLSYLKSRKNPKPPVIIIEDLDKTDDEKTDSKKGNDTLANLLRRDSLKTIARKAKEKQAGSRKTKPKDMSHIKAKWLLGLSLTMVSVALLSSSYILFHYRNARA